MIGDPGMRGRRIALACNLPVPLPIVTIKSVLIVGEDRLIAWAIRKRFSAMQISSRVVATPDEALAELRKNPYGFVVFDPGLLETEGPGGIEKFRRISSAAGIRIAEADAIA